MQLKNANGVYFQNTKMQGYRVTQLLQITVH